MRRKTFRTSFVVTVAGSVINAAGCGGSSVDSADGGGHETGGRMGETGGGEGTGGRRATGGAFPAGGTPTTGGVPYGPGGALPFDTGGTTWGTGGFPTGGSHPMGGSIGTGGATEICGKAFQSACPASGFCALPLACTGSRLQTFTVDCSTGFSLSDQEKCERPYDHCSTSEATFEPNTYCEGGRWQLDGIGGNPPRPCDAEPPVIGSSCVAGGYGQSHEYCGYPCAATTPHPGAWTVLRCGADELDDSGTTHWISDGACDSEPDVADAGIDAN